MRAEYDFSTGVRGKYAGKVPHEVLQTHESPSWRNPSVRLLAGGRDALEVVREKARAIILEALDTEAVSLPVDPFKLAEWCSVTVVPRPDVREAQIVLGLNDKAIIEYNPDRPKARIRFSICHELAHTLFPDWNQQVRHRGFHTHPSSTAQELETLCNVAAAEFLLPIGSFQADMENLSFSIDSALRLRTKYEASVEAVLLRLVGLSAAPWGMFAASVPQSQEMHQDIREQCYRLEYVKCTPNWDAGLRRGDSLPFDTVIRQCTAIGVTAKAEEQWISGGERLRIEAVGTQPYLQNTLPRIVGLIRPTDSTYQKPLFEVLRGDALQPRGDGPKIVAHVVNDKTANWGAGFGREVQAKWPSAQQHFKSVLEGARGSKLGLTAISRVGEDIYTFQMVCQRGYGPSPTPRLRYEALRRCLSELREVAHQKHATVHMPKIGTGEAGGSWALVSNLVAEELCASGVAVTVYEKTRSEPSRKKQTGLFDNTAQ